jgi:hypothetical protein
MSEQEPLRIYVLLAIKEIRRLGEAHKALLHPKVKASMSKAKNTTMSPETLESDMRDLMSAVSDATIFDILYDQTFPYWLKVASPTMESTKQCARAFCNVFGIADLPLEYQTLINTIFGSELTATSRKMPDGTDGFPQNTIAGREYRANMTNDDGCIFCEDDLKRLAMLLTKLVQSAILYVHKRRNPIIMNGVKGYSFDYKLEEVKPLYWSQQFRPPLVLPWPEN